MRKYINRIICNYTQNKVALTIFKIATAYYFNHLPIRIIGVVTEKQERLTTSTFNVA